MKKKSPPSIMSNMITTSQFKPVDEISQLIEHFLPHSYSFSIKKDEIIHYINEKERECFLIHQGVISLHRLGDGLLLSSEQAPFIFGLSNQHSSNNALFLRSEEPCLVSRLSLQKVIDIISEHNLWKSQAKFLAFITSRWYDHSARTCKMSSYDIIRLLLIELMNEPEAFRLSITAANYIKNRCFLSRSGIMRILSELRAGGYIKTERGILLGFNYLPLKY